MEKQQLTPQNAFQIIFEMTGTLQLNRKDSHLLNEALKQIASLLPQEGEQAGE